MSKPIINGINVSECEYLNKVVNEEPYCNIDQEHLYTCSSDENCYFKQLKRLQKENKRLQILSCANCGEKYLSPDGAELYEKNVQLQEENEELKARLITLDDEALTVEITPDEFERYKKYKQALEEIREIIFKNDPECACNISNIIIKKINEVLNDRD